MNVHDIRITDMHQCFLMEKWTQKEEGQHGAAVYCDSDRRNPWREGIGPPVLGGRTGTEDMQE